MAIGYEKAKNLMKQLDWKAKLMCEAGNGRRRAHIFLYHPKRLPRVYQVRDDSWSKLQKECRVCGHDGGHNEIWCYDHDGSNEALI